MDPSDFADVLASVREFVREQVVPREDEIEEADEVGEPLREACKAMGLYGFAIPETYGGIGLSMSEEVELAMELGWTTPSLRSLFGTNNGIAGQVLLTGGTEAQRAEWLPRLASGEVVASFALTEPDAGSDPSSLTTKAVRDGDEFVISGTKRWITNAPLADVLMVFARTDPDAAPARGISTFLVPTSSPGVSFSPHDAKMGQRGSWTCEVYLDDVRVPAVNLIGGESQEEGQGGLHRGYVTALKCLAHGRLHIAALCMGMAARLVHETVEFASTREQGGHAIATYQLVQGLVADSVTDWHAGRALVREAARAYDDGSDKVTGPSTAKYFCSEAVGRIADRAVQVHGGSGYMRGVPVERIYRDVRLFRIYEGTSQIQQVIIARGALGKAARG
ncbi:acyl-CoA dehydrogenase family protein [Actinomycetospora sp. TBRC 11914]|uniref:acyl-CoA dehydrogenase family protein n=1 Tax=Actinomycetospora sp. TBRC 11914 TaxID=2729387 RepID=UPI00145F6E2C|nr:acyl-CoA dehydrogenase family protein [Actinomycetospora sp. TBRC 11914]NMO92631.1 acyl-CoA dehydrogenase [Actinomycetospora sp. TBRC 11914]